MKTNRIVSRVIAVMLIAVSLQSCSKLGNKVEEPELNGGDVLIDEQGAETKDLTSLGYIKLKDHYFKLTPDIAQGEESHLDFYIRDIDGKHVPGATVQLTLTAPDSTKQTFDLSEDEGGEHYHNKTVLQKGKYQAVAQIKIGNESYNPRFEFDV